MCWKVTPLNFYIKMGKHFWRRSNILSSLHFIGLYTLISPHNHLCGIYTFANFEVVWLLPQDIILHFGEETKSQTLSWLHQPHSGFLQDGPSVMKDDEFLTCQVKTVLVDMLRVSKRVKSRRWISEVVVTMVCSLTFSCRRRDCSISWRILRSRAFNTRFRWASPLAVHGFPHLSFSSDSERSVHSFHHWHEQLNVEKYWCLHIPIHKL